MCGIAGFLQLDYDADFPTERARSAVAAMAQAMAQRGPETKGPESISRSPTLVFAQRRRATLPDAPAPSPSLVDPRTGNALVLNGMISNAQELRQRLGGTQPFHGHADSELILNAYAQWGLDALPRLRGSFAFALWDAPQRQLILARDPLGSKALYYGCHNGALLFASELRALLAGGVPATLSSAGLHSFLAYGAVQEPYTLVQDLHSLPPGHSLCCQAQQQELQPFWQPPNSVASQPRQNPRKALPELQQEVQAALQGAVAAHYSGDGKQAILLSGGIDSAAIAAILRQHSNDELFSLTLAFADKRYDERHFTALSAKANRLNHSEIELSEQDLKNLLPAAIKAFDQPSIDGLNTWLAARAARAAGFRTALSGIGGDELFVGYDAFRNPRRLHRWQKFLRQRPARAALAALAKRSSSEKWRKLARLASYPYPAYFLTRQIISPELRAELLNPNRHCVNTEDWENRCFADLSQYPQQDLINAISFWEMRTYMLSTLLRDSEQMGMAHGVDIRAPLIDQNLVELMLSIPGHAKLGSCAKPLLVAAAGAGLPAACVQRPKQGFVLPFDHFFQHALRPELQESFHPVHDGLFRRQALAKLWQGYQEQRVPWGRIWMIYVLRHWLQQHLAIS
jgi:asparagine synthase (glutamine-hydrolysing)